MEEDMRNIIPFVLIALVFSLQGCWDDGGSGVYAGAPTEALSLDGQVIACQEDSDCTVVELGCCDHCNGGWSASINKDYAEQVELRNHDSCESDEFCTEMWCGYEFPRCVNGQCSARTEDWNYCEEDSDCVVVELGCCDHCNGGRVVVANIDHAQDVKETMGDDCEWYRGCTLMACAPYVPFCDEGTCYAEQDPEWGP
jgi:hypothetical protein